MGDFFYSVIEGFYGRQWSWQSRRDYAGFLKQHGFGHYIYAPKGDAYLRAQWRTAHPASDWQQLIRLADHYHALGVGWGLGLSPLGLSERYSADDKRQLKEKVARLNQLSPDIVCILFDDLRGDIDGLAQRQLEVVDDIVSVSGAARHIVCPTYYSFDPVLEQVFGVMPARYWETLGAQLATDIGLFWTGNRVIADTIGVEDLRAVEQLFRRKPVIWDNYPVNDGKATSPFLHLRPYQGRSWALQRQASAHIVNPMNQPALSRLVLQSLPSLYRLQAGYNCSAALDAGLAELGCESLADRLRRDLGLFQDHGLASLSELECQRKIQQYRCFDHPAAVEVVEWLQGGYQFDPDCLTG